MRPDTVIGMQQHLLETAVDIHTLVFGEILEKRRETFLQTHRHVDSLNFDRRAGVEQVMSKHEVIPMQVAHGIVADAVWPVVDGRGNLDSIGAVEFVQLVGVANKEIDRTSVGAGRRGAFRQEHLDLTKVHAGKGRRLAPCERLLEAELLDVEFDGSRNVTDRQAGVDLLAFDERQGWAAHNICSLLLSAPGRRTVLCWPSSYYHRVRSSPGGSLQPGRVPFSDNCGEQNFPPR